MASRKTKLFIYTNGVLTDIIYSPALFTTIDQLTIFLQEKGYSFTNSELTTILNSQIDTETECCEELTPISPIVNINFPTNTTASLEIINYSTQEDKNDYFVEILLNDIVIQTVIITTSITNIINLEQGTLYTFRVISQTCSNKVVVETILQTPPILLIVTVIGGGTSPQAVNGSQIHTLSSGDDFYIEFNGGVVNSNELWYYKSIIKDSSSIENLVNFTETINNVNTDGNLTLVDIVQNTEIVITFSTRTAQWCTDISCIVCDELLEQATLNVLYVYENGVLIQGAPFTINAGADPQVIAETYFLSTELCTELIASQIVSSTGICCFEDLPILSNLQITSVTNSSLNYTFDSQPLLATYTATIRRLPINQLIQQEIVNTLNGSFIGLETDVEYEIKVSGSNCSGTSFDVITGKPVDICTDPVLVISSVIAIPTTFSVTITLTSTGSEFTVFVYEHETDSMSPITGLIQQFITTNLVFTVDDLNPLTTYRIEINTSNCAGISSNFVVTTTLTECLDFDPGDMIDPIVIP